MSTERADRMGKPLAIAVGVVAIGTVIAAIWLMGSPDEQRRARIDAGRVDDLAAIEEAVREYAVDQGRLPADLAALKSPGRTLHLDDREGRGAYEYAVVDPQHFRLCATFDTDTAQRPTIEYPASLPRWAHGAGRHCFKRARTSKDADAVRIEQP